MPSVPSIPAIHSWNLANYGRRRNPASAAQNEYFWSVLDSSQTPLRMTITPTLQLMIISSEQCIEELIGNEPGVCHGASASCFSALDIWLVFDSIHVHVQGKSALFAYAWPPSSTSARLTRSFRVKFHDDNDLSQCLTLLRDYFPVDTYSPTDVNVRLDTSEPTRLHPLFFSATKDALVSEQSTLMTIRPDFMRQYLSTCIMDPAFFTLVNKNEQRLRKLLTQHQ